MINIWRKVVVPTDWIQVIQPPLFISLLTHSCLSVPLLIALWNYNTFDDHLGTVLDDQTQVDSKPAGQHEQASLN